MTDGRGPYVGGYVEDYGGGAAFDPWQILQIVRRRWVTSAVTLAILLPLALVAPLLVPPSYLGVSKVAIEDVPEVMSFGADFMPETARSRRSSPLASIRALVLSDRVLGRVIDQLPQPEETAPPEPPGTLGRVAQALGLAPIRQLDLPPEVQRHKRIGSLRGLIGLGEDGGGSILLIRVEHEDAARSAYVANAVADAFVSYEDERHRSASSAAINWLSQKEHELRDRLERKQEAISRVAASIGDLPRTYMPASPGEGGERNELRGELRRVRLDLFTVEQRLAQLEPRMGADGGVPTDTSQMALRARYQQTRQALDEVRLRFKSTHPEVKRLQATVAQLRRQLGPSAASAEDPLAMRRLQEFEELSMRRDQLMARQAVIEGAFAESTASVMHSAGARANYERLAREIDMDTELLGVIQGRISNTVLAAAREAASARVLDYATIPHETAGKRRLQAFVGGLAVAFMLALGMGVLRELLDRSEYDAARAAATLGVPLLESIPQLPGGSAAERQSSLAHATVAGERFRSLRTMLIHTKGSAPLRSLMVGSAVAGEGKTTVSINLAATFAKTDRRVVLVDADMRRPRVDRVLSISRAPGLSEILRGEVELESAIVRPIGLEFDVIPSGTVQDKPAELLDSSELDRLLARLTKEYDLVLFDAPVLLAVTDALLLASRVGGVLLVNRPGFVDKRAFERMAADLERVEANVLGLVANQVSSRDPEQYPSYLQSPYLENDGRKRRFGRRSRSSKERSRSSKSRSSS